MDEILLSESNLERVYMDADWNVRIEHTEAGQARLDKRARAQRAQAQRARRTKRTVAAIGTPYLVAAAAIAWKVTR